MTDKPKLITSQICPSATEITLVGIGYRLTHLQHINLDPLLFFLFFFFGPVFLSLFFLFVFVLGVCFLKRTKSELQQIIEYLVEQRISCFKLARNVYHETIIFLSVGGRYLCQRYYNKYYNETNWKV